MNTKMFALCEVKAVEDGEDPNGGFDVVLSAPTLDRDDEVIDAKAFEPLPDHITFDIDHGMSTATTVGSGVPFYDEQNRLRVKGTYSSIPRAQEVRTLVREGHIRTTSVAFMNAQRGEGEDGKTHITQAELLNGAFVPIPSNRESVVLSGKSYASRVDTEDFKISNLSVAAAQDLAEHLEGIDSMFARAVASDLRQQLSASTGTSAPALQPSLPVSRKSHDMSANELREALDRVVREAYGDEQTYTWVRDFADEWVVFEASSSDTYSTWRQAYAVDGGMVSLTDDPTEVVPHITYEAVEKPAPTDSATTAPVPPEDDSGKAPASTVVSEIVRDLRFALTPPESA